MRAQQDVSVRGARDDALSVCCWASKRASRTVRPYPPRNFEANWVASHSTYCRYMTLTKNSRHRVCPVCLWEDDGQNDHDADRVRDGSNGVSLTQARFNFLTFGAYDEVSIPFARRPMPSEHPAN